MRDDKVEKAMPLSQLSPQPVWSVFQDLCAIPHPSGHEEEALRYLEKRLNDTGIENWRDSGGNLMMRKPASTGCETAPGVVLQSHIDMVPQKADGIDHNFETDPLNLLIEEGWVTADGTTLGADNGIGVAAIMAVMLANDIKHGPLEGLITIDEERGLSGAQNLERSVLKGDILLNLDSEDEGELFIGCAGGADFEAVFPYRVANVPAGLQFHKFRLSGLSGGHSGLDIHRGRANAIQLLARFLGTQLTRLRLGLASLDGGTLMNAIPRDAEMVVGVPIRFAEEFDKAFSAFEQQATAQYRLTDPNLKLERTKLDQAPARMMDSDFTKQLLSVLRNCPSQALRMSPDAPGVTETSNNLAVIRTDQNSVRVTCMARSLITDAQEETVNSICDLFELAGAEVKKGGRFSGWTPNPDSFVLEKAQATYKTLTGKDAKVNVIHAGLECGLLGEAYPNWDMLSFGPTIRGAHSPDERVEIKTVESFWVFLKKMLAALT